MKEIIVAKFTHEGKGYVGKREVKVYDEGTTINTIVLKHANQGLRLDTQRQIREALKEKNGLKSTTSGGEAVDYSAIEEV